jgi:carbon storage regulator
MLVLSRYCDESVCIGDDIVITIVDVRSDRVRIGINAPSNVSVHRQEVYDAISREKKVDAKNQHEQFAAPVTKCRTTRTKNVGHNTIQNNNRTKNRKTPLNRKLPEQRGKALPVEIETHNIGFGGITSVIND